MRRAEAPQGSGIQVIHYLLDASVVSELRKPKPHGAVVAWPQSLREDQIYISAVTIGSSNAVSSALESRTRTKLEKSQSGSTKWKLQATCSHGRSLLSRMGPA